MSTIFDSLKSLISNEMISKASTLVGENNSQVSNAVSSIIPSILGVFLKNGNTPQIKNIIEEAGNLNILSGIKNVFEDKPSQSQQKIGDDFLQHLLGDNASGFTDAIAGHSGISKVATNSLISMIAPVVTGFLGNKLISEKWNFHDLLGELKKEKSSFASFIPSGLTGLFGLSSILAPEKITTNSRPHIAEPQPKKKSNYSWLTWLIILLVLLLAALFAWKSCHKTPKQIETTAIAVTDTIKTKVSDAIENVQEKVSTVLELPSGIKLNAFKNGIEDQMIAFLNSDEYKNDTEEQLKNKWFNFDNIEFIHGSGTELTKESYPQLDNIAAILKHFNGTKIKIGGYTDKTGNSDVNKKISQERANTIKSILEKAGIDGKTITAEGYGDQFAKYPAEAPDAERAHDRIMALRFVK